MISGRVNCELSEHELGRIVVGLKNNVQAIQEVMPDELAHGWMPSDFREQMESDVGSWLETEVRVLVKMQRLYLEAMRDRLADHERSLQELDDRHPYLDASTRDRFRHDLHARIERFQEAIPNEEADLDQWESFLAHKDAAVKARIRKATQDDEDEPGGA